MGRPRKPKPAASPPLIARKADLRMVSIRLGPDDTDAIDRIVKTLRIRGHAQANRTQAMRWAIKELDARVSGRDWPEPGPSFGSITEPPEA